MRKALLTMICAASILLLIVLFVSPSERVEANAGEPAKALVQEDRVPVRYGEFDVEVLVDGVQLDEYAARGRRYVEAQQGREYDLQIRNPFGVRVAVALSVDGLNTIDARRTTATEASKWVIEPYGTITVRGWQMSSERARRFYFTTERDSYGTKLGQTSNLGVISAVFFRERRPLTIVPRRRTYPLEDDVSRTESNRAPTAERKSERDGAAGAKSRSAQSYPVPDDEYAATGIGRNVHDDVRWVDMNLESRPMSEVTIRYEYRPALVRLGIIPRPFARPDALRRRERSSGFEDRRYSPEP